jgi:hypothetical protein
MKACDADNKQINEMQMSIHANKTSVHGREYTVTKQLLGMKLQKEMNVT